jgi:hypothetical protein
VRNGNLSQEGSKAILERAMAYRLQSSEDNPIPVVGLAAMLRTAMSGTEAQ